jgi:hypothetical protein
LAVAYDLFKEPRVGCFPDLPGEWFGDPPSRRSRNARIAAGGDAVGDTATDYWRCTIWVDL